ncbi:MAG: hypothetical protein WAK17_23635 [Candidatus Nitrosopolaris sp.]
MVQREKKDGGSNTSNIPLERFMLPEGVYRIGRTDNLRCNFCKVTDDKWGMSKHECRKK